jgi:hypothetical protein
MGTVNKATWPAMITAALAQVVLLVWPDLAPELLSAGQTLIMAMLVWAIPNTNTGA